MTSQQGPVVPFRVRPRVRHPRTLNGFDANAAVASLQAAAAAAPMPAVEPAPTPPVTPVRDDVLDAEELIAERYRLEDLLQSTETSETWAAFDLHLGRDVVIRIFSDDAEGEAAASRAGRQARSSFPAETVATFRDEGVHEGRAFVVVERVLGETLASRVEREGALDPAECAVIFTSAAAALDALHDRGFHHGAIDGGTLFFARGDSASPARLVLLAPGVAGLLDAGSGAPAPLGVPARAPELQLGEAEPDARTDVYALAAVLYRALTGRAPFVGRSASDARQRVLTAQFAMPTSLRPDLPSPLDAFFRRAFAVEPHRRFATARELAAVFRMVVEDRARTGSDAETRAPEVTLWGRVRSGVRFAAVAAVLATGTVVAIWALLDRADVAEAPAAIEAPR